jgi:hypothetical protein
VTASGSVGETGQTPELPDDMIELAARSLASDVDWSTVGGTVRAYYRGRATEMLTVALTGRTVVQLPEPDETYTDSILRARWSLCTAIVGSRGPKVNVLGGPYLDPDVAESRGAELIAAARLARRLAAESSGDGEPQ